MIQPGSYIKQPEVREASTEEDNYWLIYVMSRSDRRFTKALGEAYRQANKVNATKLEETFPEIFDRCRNEARLLKNQVFGVKYTPPKAKPII